MADQPQLRSVQEIENANYNNDVNRSSMVPIYNPLNIATSAQTLVKSGAGVLGGVHVGVGILTSGVKLYDNVVSGGTVIASFAAGLSAGYYPLPARFLTGLVVSSGAAADNVTIFYL